MDTLLYYIPNYGLALSNVCGFGNHEACSNPACDCNHHSGPPIDPPNGNGNGETEPTKQQPMLKKHHIK